MDKLKEKMLKCTDCDLCQNRVQVVFGHGNKHAKLMLIGEAPGEEESLQGIPFVGKAGQKLDSILKFIDLKREDIWISNSVLCRPPQNRKPTFEELAACRWRLEKEIEYINPEVMILLGKTALEQIMNKPVKGSLNQFFPKNPEKEDGDWLIYKMGDRQIKTMVTFHPSFLLRSPEKGYQISLPHWKMIKAWLVNQK